VTALVESINRQSLRVRIRGVRIAFASTQWGSCNPRGIIMVNVALLLLPPRFLKYIIIHELAHRIRADHSDAFWRVVKSAMPNYDTVRKELMEYRLPTL
jgi:predicted metal-dependent hydrolase